MHKYRGREREIQKQRNGKDEEETAAACTRGLRETRRDTNTQQEREREIERDNIGQENIQQYAHRHHQVLCSALVIRSNGPFILIGGGSVS